MTTHLALKLGILPAYLLVGCAVMLTIDAILDGIVTKRELLRGMVLWPVLILAALWGFLEHVYVMYLT